MKSLVRHRILYVAGLTCALASALASAKVSNRDHIPDSAPPISKPYGKVRLVQAVLAATVASVIAYAIVLPFQLVFEQKGYREKAAAHKLGVDLVALMQGLEKLARNLYDPRLHAAVPSMIAEVVPRLFLKLLGFGLARGGGVYGGSVEQLSRAFLGALCAGSLVTLYTHPFTVASKQQALEGATFEEVLWFLREKARHHGVISLYQGVSFTWVRILSFNLIIFLMYEAMCLGTGNRFALGLPLAGFSVIVAVFFAPALHRLWAIAANVGLDKRAVIHAHRSGPNSSSSHLRYTVNWKAIENYLAQVWEIFAGTAGIAHTLGAFRLDKATGALTWALFIHRICIRL